MDINDNDNKKSNNKKIKDNNETNDQHTIAQTSNSSIMEEPVINSKLNPSKQDQLITNGQTSNSSIIIEPIKKDKLKTSNENQFEHKAGDILNFCRCMALKGKCENCKCKIRGFCMPECHNGKKGLKCTLPLQKC